MTARALRRERHRAARRAAGGRGASAPPAQESAAERPWAGAAGRADRLLPLLPALLAAAAYANTIGNGFVNDDEHLILLNPWLESFRSLGAIFGDDAWGFAPGPPMAEFYRPLMHLVFLALHQLAGPEAWAFHLANVLLHAANTLLVFLLVARWVGAGAESRRPGARRVPFVTALLFALHPVHTEAVAWIAALPELVFTLFGLAALLLDARPGGPTARRSTAIGTLFLLALLGKETAITLLAIAVIQHGIVRGRSRPFALEWRRLAPYLAATAIYLVARGAALSGVSIAAGHSWNLGPASWLLNVMALFAQYLRYLVVPVGMAYWHPFEPVASLATAAGAVALLVAAAFAAAAWLAWRRSRLALLALAWIVVPLTPTFLLDRFPRTPFAERYLYLSVLGSALLVALGFDALARRRALRGVAAILLLALATGYAAATVTRNRVWKDAYTLFMDSVRKAPDTPRPPVALASKLVERGRFDEALAHHRILVAMEPDNPGVHSAMAGALSIAGRSDEALKHFERAVALAPEDPFLHNLLAIEHARRGELEDAREHLQIATRLAPDEPAYRNNLERLGPPAP